MKKIKALLITLIVIGLFGGSNATAQVYKYTDEDGNVQYSDQKPFADAKQEKLKSITIIPSAKIEPKIDSKRQQHKEKQAAKQFPNFTISTPSDGVTLSGTGGNVLATVNLNEELRSNYRINFYIDDLPHGKVKSKSQLIADVVRGEHTIYAEMIDASTRRVILTTPKSIFYMKQHSKK